MQKKKENSKNGPKDRQKILYIVLSACALAALIIVIWALPVRSYLVGILEWTRGLGIWAPLVVILAYIVATVLFLPGSVLTDRKSVV